VKDPDKTEEFRWIQSKAKYHKGEGKVSITFSDDVMPYLTQLKGFFTKIAVKNVSSLKSAYSIRMYELLMQFSKTGERLITIGDFRKIMAVEDKYAQFKELNKFVIKSSINELNKKSNLIVAYDVIKNGRMVVALHFHVKEDNKIKLL
jgi:plasmid replication initiation protein